MQSMITRKRIFIVFSIMFLISIFWIPEQYLKYWWLAFTGFQCINIFFDIKVSKQGKISFFIWLVLFLFWFVTILLGN